MSGTAGSNGPTIGTNPGVTITLSYDGIGLGPDVARAAIVERLSDTFRAELDLLTDNPGYRPWTQLGKPAAVSLAIEAGTRTFYGVADEIRMMGMIGDRYWWRFVIVPPLALMALTRRSRCFLTTGTAAKRKVWDVLTAILANTGLPIATTPVLPNATQTALYPDLPCALQVDETDLAVLQRTAADAGISWSLSSADGKTFAITFYDTLSSFPPIGGTTGPYRIDPAQILTASLGLRMTSASATMNAWSADAPSTNLASSATTPAPAGAAGTIIAYERAYTTTAAGQAMANVRLEEALAHRASLQGTSVVIAFQSSQVFTLALPGQTSPAHYLLTEVVHTAWQSLPGAEGLLAQTAGAVFTTMGYSNRYTAVPCDSTTGYYRPARTTPTPAIAGLLRATLCDATGSTSAAKAGDPTKAYMDSAGRYQVLLPFPDATGAGAGTLFAPLRQVTPFGGSLEGWAMPLRVGTTVYLAFEGGSIDRPMIVGVVPNAAQPGPLPVPAAQLPAGAPANILQTIIRTSSGITVKVTDGATIVVPVPPKTPVS